jgi:hypothetical protein
MEGRPCVGEDGLPKLLVHFEEERAKDLVPPDELCDAPCQGVHVQPTAQPKAVR